MRYLKQLFICLFFLSSSAYSQTTVTGNIYSSTTWTLAGSPYIIANNIVVFSGSTLTIDPGVTVLFNDTLAVDFRGKLVANGTPTARITFSSSSTSPHAGIYRGFKVSSSGPSITNQVTMSYCNILYAADFMDLAYTSSGPFNFSHCCFKFNRYPDGNSADFAVVNFDSCWFEGNYQGVYWNDGGKYVYANNCTFINDTMGTNAVHVSNCYFSGCSRYATYANEADATVEYCVIEHCNVGAIWTGYSGTNFAHNYVHDNYIGLQLGGIWPTTFNSFKNNRICHNTLWNIQYGYSTDADISGNCFCSSDSAFIRSTLRDGYVNASYGLLSFNIDSSCDAGMLEVEPLPVSNTSEIRIRPNPFNSSTTLEFSYLPGHTYQVAVIDLAGRVVSRIEHITTGAVTISRGDLSPGLYYYQLRNEQEVLNVGKLVIQ